MTFKSMTWDEIVAEPLLRQLPHKIEQDGAGRILMSPPPAAVHGRYQARIISLLTVLLPDWVVSGDCPVQTQKGVRAPDAAALRREHLEAEGEDTAVYRRAPAICVEIASPRNSEQELEEKRDLFLGAGCEEFWLCSIDGRMTFTNAAGRRLERSVLCPSFSAVVVLA